MTSTGAHWHPYWSIAFALRHDSQGDNFKLDSNLRSYAIVLPIKILGLECGNEYRKCRSV